MIGIEMRFECEECGTIKVQQSPFWTKKLRKAVDDPKKCVCGEKDFILLSVEQCEFEIEVEKDGVQQDSIES